MLKPALEAEHHRACLSYRLTCKAGAKVSCCVEVDDEPVAASTVEMKGFEEPGAAYGVSSSLGCCCEGGTKPLLELSACMHGGKELK